MKLQSKQDTDEEVKQSESEKTQMQEQQMQ
jgi:hypothetical protein